MTRRCSVDDRAGARRTPNSKSDDSTASESKAKTYPEEKVVEGRALAMPSGDVVPVPCLQPAGGSSEAAGRRLQVPKVAVCRHSRRDVPCPRRVRGVLVRRQVQVGGVVGAEVEGVVGGDGWDEEAREALDVVVHAAIEVRREASYADSAGGDQSCNVGSVRTRERIAERSVSEGWRR